MITRDILADAAESFITPSDEFTPVPFWFWNDVLSYSEIKRQMDAFKAKGINAFVIHPRIGLPETQGYLSDEFMDFVLYTVNYARQTGMHVVLYDEGMYPSGSAHGEVVRSNPTFASKGLYPSHTPETENKTIAKIGDTYFILGKSGGTIRGIHYGEDDGEPGAPPSADLLNPAAVQSFITHTHERYYQYLKPFFGNTITAFFTDEPNILGRCSRTDMIPWTDDFLDFYISNGGKMEDLPFLFQKENSPEKERYRKILYKRLGSSYYQQLSIWCVTHGIALTGHPENSEDIGCLQYFQIPCQDIVWRYIAPGEGTGLTGQHSTMGKCSSDSARHRGKMRNGNECFGCCGAKDDPLLFTRDDMKWYLDWLFVRGVNLVYPHAFFYSIRAERIMERPPDVGMHSSFWDDYKTISTYIKRMCWLLTGSVNQTETAILCSYNKLSWQAAKPLFEHQLEFNYLEEELLPQCTIQNGALLTAGQRYTTIITDGVYESGTTAVLERFRKNGGNVLAFNEKTILSDLEKVTNPDFRVVPENSDLRKTHICKNGIHFYLLTNEGEDTISTQIQLPGFTILQIWDAENGTTKPCEQQSEYCTVTLEKRKSLILVADRT